MLKTKLQKYLKDSLGQKVPLEHPSDPSHGDFSTNIAITTFPRTKYGSPLEFAEKLKLKIVNCKLEILDKVEVAPPGFINFWISKEALFQNLQPPFKGTTLKGRKILVEFAHPNTHKLFHIGHLRNITIGESLSRLLEFQSARVIRANYQGDIGLHIAKALYGLQKVKSEKLKVKSLEERIKILSQAYVKGNKAYEEDQKAKAEIVDINKHLYAGDKELTNLWQGTKGWSLEYFDAIYTRLGTKFDRLYFESEVAESGKEIVEENLSKVFEKSDGAVIFPGEKYGLHTRVFVNSEELATYEAKDLGLAYLQMKEFSPDLITHVVGSEQSGYFQVLFKALELLDEKFKNLEKHIVYGWVRLKEGKMSSREGNAVEAETVLNEVKSRLIERYSMDEAVGEQVAVGAVKYSLLKPSTTQEIAFDIDESIDLEGNSGPYIQYTFARTQSVLGKAKLPRYPDTQIPGNPNAEELDILRHLYRFPEVVEESAVNLAPNLLCNFLYELAQKYNTFYNKHRILGLPSADYGLQQFRLSLTTATGNILKEGLFLLGISAPDKM